MGQKRLSAAIFAALLILVFATSVQAGLTAQEITRLQAELDAKGATFTVGPNPATEYDISELCGLVPPDNWQARAFFDAMEQPLAVEPLPSSFNWCDLGACPPVRNQGGCGSCWAFGTVGPLESNILIHGGDAPDLSEQYLVSCNSDGWGCGGGWWAHDYHQWKFINPPETEAGAVPEGEFPYVASDVACGGPYTHPWKIEDWAYIGSGWSIPSVDQIKQAIMDYGPVAAAVCAGSFFSGYSGGIFNVEETQYCVDKYKQDINHAIVLVGWDDNQGTNGVWILRNSWGSGWGEGGYMRIEYGTSQVGYAASYVVYSPGIVADFTGEPTGGVSPHTVSFTDLSTGTIDSWAWDFGDGASSSEQNPVHTYEEPGAYTVSLTVSGPSGSDTKTATDYISVTSAPVKSFIPALMLLR